MRYTSAVSLPPIACFNASLYTDIHEQLKHEHAMQALAEELGLPLQNIVDLYESILENLKAQARISDYLPVLATKRVKQILLRH